VRRADRQPRRAYDRRRANIAVREDDTFPVTARLARTRPSGRFRIRYRFQRRARLAVRIRMPGQPAWPLFGNISQQRRIRLK